MHEGDCNKSKRHPFAVIDGTGAAVSTGLSQQANPSREFEDSRLAAGWRFSQMTGFANTLTILFMRTLIYSGAGTLKLPHDHCATS
jgi:hypothetical protein